MMAVLARSTLFAVLAMIASIAAAEIKQRPRDRFHGAFCSTRAPNLTLACGTQMPCVARASSFRLTPLARLIRARRAVRCSPREYHSGVPTTAPTRARHFVTRTAVRATISRRHLLPARRHGRGSSDAPTRASTRPTVTVTMAAPVPSSASAHKAPTALTAAHALHRRVHRLHRLHPRLRRLHPHLDAATRAITRPTATVMMAAPARSFMSALSTQIASTAGCAWPRHHLHHHHGRARRPHAHRW